MRILCAVLCSAAGLLFAGPVAPPGLVFNDLEGPVSRRHPEIGRAKEALVEAGVTAAVMCGSGPSVAGFLPDGMERLPSDAEAGLEAISGRPVTYAGSWRE